MSNVVMLWPPKPKFQKTIVVDGEPEGRAIVVTVEADNCGLITVEIKGGGGPTDQSEILSEREARALAAALIRAAEKGEALYNSA